jgi:hypothetical protein
MSHKVEYKTLFASQLAEYLDKLVDDGNSLVAVQHISEINHSLFKYMIVYRANGLGASF